MNTAITINLNGRAFQADENAYQLLQEYLRQSTEKLANDPDMSEIIADIEQALADKFSVYISAGKNVITEAEAKEVISEMGPVEEAASSSSSHTSGAAHTTSTNAQNNTGVKKLYRIREGSMVFGICTGLAAYFGISVVLIRIIFVILVVSTHAFWVLIYFIMMLIIPTAETSAEQAAAYGAPFTAQEFVNRARAEYQKMGANGEWKQTAQQTAHDWKHKMRQEKKRMRREMKNWHKNQQYQNHQWFSPITGLLVAATTVVWVYGLVSLVSHTVIFGLAIPVGMPIWVAILIWTLVYIAVSGAVRALTRHGYVVDHKGNSYHYGGPFQGLAWIFFVLVIGWLVYHFFPQSHPTFMQAQQAWLQFWHKIQ